MTRTAGKIGKQFSARSGAAAIAMLLSTLLVIGSAGAVTIQQGVIFESSNVKFFFGSDFTVDQVDISSSFLNITKSSAGDFIVSATPSSNSINVTVIEFTTSVKRFNVSSGNSSVTVDFIVGNLTPSVSVSMMEDGTTFTTQNSNSTGYVSFTYDGGFGLNPTTIEISAPQSSPATSSNGGSGGGSGGSSASIPQNQSVSRGENTGNIPASSISEELPENGKVQEPVNYTQENRMEKSEGASSPLQTQIIVGAGIAAMCAVAIAILFLRSRKTIPNILT